MWVFRKIAAAKHARDLHESDESTISTAIKECLGVFSTYKGPYGGAEDFSSKFGSWKGSFCHSANRFRQKFDFPKSNKSGSQFRKVCDKNSFAVGFGYAPCGVLFNNKI